GPEPDFRADHGVLPPEPHRVQAPAPHRVPHRTAEDARREDIEAGAAVGLHPPSRGGLPGCGPRLMAANLPPCGGDVRQDRGGREGTRPPRLARCGIFAWTDSAPRSAQPAVPIHHSPFTIHRFIPLPITLPYHAPRSSRGNAD